MSDTTPLFNGQIHWPEGINEQVFLDRYWQKKPLLIRQAFPDFDTPLPADELAGLSLEPDTSGRIITQDANGAYHLEHGPFEDERFSRLSGNQWSLLVTDVEKHLPEFLAYLQPFRFIPDWRIDDLMISYAPDGASVGAHIDEYDVFLLQGSGIRQWSIDAAGGIEPVMRSDGDLKIIANFTATDTWDLVAGDMLYLPPKMAHHGVAVGDDCTTWSIGFRAPLIPDMIARLAELIGETLEASRYTDAALTPARHGEISDSSVQRFKAIWDQATQLSNAEFSEMLGCWLSESNNDTQHPDVENQKSNQPTHTDDTVLNKASFSRFAWIAKPERAATLFVDGMSVPCSQEFAELICESVHRVVLSNSTLATQDSHALNMLIGMGSLLPEETA